MVLGNQLSFLIIEWMINQFISTVNVKIDEDDKRSTSNYDPHAPITREGVLTCLRTRKRTEISECDMVIVVPISRSRTISLSLI